MVYKKLKYLFCLFLISGCDVSENGPQPVIPSLQIIETHNLTVPEPSGLSLYHQGNFLWTVSDQTGSVYKIDYSGREIESFNINGNDLEGISYNPFTNELLVAEEYLAEIVLVDTLGNIKARYEILNSHDNSGLEGVCVDDDGNIFALKEKLPGQWISLNPDFSVNETINLTFADDFSDMTCDSTANRFWIISDQNQQLFLWDKNEGVMETYNLPVENPEGIAYDRHNKLFYVVSDSQQQLYILSRE